MSELGHSRPWRRRPESDVDVAVVLKGIRDRRVDRDRLSDIAHGAIVETGIGVQTLPISQDEWEQPRLHRNPDLVRAIKRDGLTVGSFPA
jgi:predicted nucleotidyltransferase